MRPWLKAAARRTEYMEQQSFPLLGVSASVSDVLARRSIVTPTPVQGMVVADGIAGHDVLAKAPTGSGKTLAFGLPIVERLDPKAHKPSALVLVPTRELAVQVAEELDDIGRARGLRSAAAYGGVSIAAQSKAVGQANILIATPGRLDDLARRKLVRLDRIQILVLDEADRMLDMGFLPQVSAIVKRLPTDRQTMFFSATLDGDVAMIARAYTRDPRRHEVKTDTLVVEDAQHRFIKVESGAKVDALVKLLTDEPGRSLVFVRTKR